MTDQETLFLNTPPILQFVICEKGEIPFLEKTYNSTSVLIAVNPDRCKTLQYETDLLKNQYRVSFL